MFQPPTLIHEEAQRPCFAAAVRIQHQESGSNTDSLPVRLPPAVCSRTRRSSDSALPGSVLVFALFIRESHRQCWRIDRLAFCWDLRSTDFTGYSWEEV